MGKYNKIDEMIIEKLSKKPAQFCEIFTGYILQECERISAEEKKDQGNAFRILDRRLQSLRKRGVIRFQKGKNAVWHMTSNI